MLESSGLTNISEADLMRFFEERIMTGGIRKYQIFAEVKEDVTAYSYIDIALECCSTDEV